MGRWLRPCCWGSAISRRDLGKLTDQPSQLAKRHAAGGFTSDIAVPEEGPFGSSQTLKTGRLRQQVARRCVPFSAPPRLFKRKCQSPPSTPE
jgi:hypothetical protein